MLVYTQVPSVNENPHSRAADRSAHEFRARRATLEVGGGGGLNSDSKWGGGLKTYFSQ